MSDSIAIFVVSGREARGCFIGGGLDCRDRGHVGTFEDPEGGQNGWTPSEC